MPVPIMRVPDDSKNNDTSMNYSFLATNPSSQKKTVTASNKDA